MTESPRQTDSLRVAFGADDDNECVRAVKGFLDERTEPMVVDAGLPWPLMARTVAGKVAAGEADFGVVMCWTGTGTAIAANKVAGARAAQAADAWTARGARLWNDANILALSLKRLAPDTAVECVEAFLASPKTDPDEADNIALLRSFDEKTPR